MSEGSDTITLDQMKAAVGTLLFLWSDIERSLHAAIETELFNGKPSSVHQISKALRVWSERVAEAGEGRPLQTALCLQLYSSLKEALVVRNLVCHGLVGYSAEVPHKSQAAHLLVDLGADRRVLTWAELQTLFQWMSQSRWLIRALTEAATERDTAVSESSLREWAEFPKQL